MASGEGSPLTAGGEVASDADHERRRVLVCTPVPPRLDLRHGARATTQLLTRLVRRHEVGVICLRATDEDPVDPVVAEHCAFVEEIPLSRASTRDVTALSRVKFALGLLRGLPPWVIDCRNTAFQTRLRRLVADWRPDVVEVHVLAMAQYVAALEGCSAGRILVDYDPPSAWAAEAVSRARGAQQLARRAELAAWRRYEQAIRPRFDANVVFAELDIAAVSATAPDARVVRIPLAFDIPSEPLDPAGQPPPTILFVGGFGHYPNVDAARWLAESIFPRVVDRVPDAQLELVGDRPGEEVRGLAGRAVAVHGSVPDVTPYLDRAAVVVTPIRLGGSMRGKVLEALGAGKALVATPRAIEGVDAVPGEHYLVASTEDEIVAATSALLADATSRRELARRARDWACSNLTWHRPVEEFERLYASVAALRSA